MLPAMKVKTVVTALDGSDHANKALDFAADLAEKYGARLILLNVLSDKPMSADERHLAAVEYHSDVLDKFDTGALMDVRGDPRAIAGMLVQQYDDAARQVHQIIGHRLVEEARVRVRGRGVEDIETMVEEGDPATRILATAKNKDADLIVLGSRGLSDLEGLLMGSVSHKVSQMAECTCITVK